MFVLGLSSNESKTTKLLRRVLDDVNLIDEFEHNKQKNKSNNQNSDVFMKTVAKIQVKLSLTLEKSKLELANIERQSFSSTPNICVVPEKEENTKYIYITNKITIINCLINQFDKF